MKKKRFDTSSKNALILKIKNQNDAMRIQTAFKWMLFGSPPTHLLYTPRIGKQTNKQINTDTDAIKTKSESLALLALKKIITHNSMLVNPKK